MLATEEFIHRCLFDFEGSMARLIFDPISIQAHCLSNAESLLTYIKRLHAEYEIEKENPEVVPILTRELGLLLIKADRLRRSQLSEKDQLAESSRRLMAFRELLNLHVSEHWTAQQYADHLSFSKRTLGSITRKYLDLSPKEMIDQRLLLEIKRYLSHTDFTITEVALHLGFEDPSNMTKFFKRLEGITPRAFRQKIKSSN